MNNIKSEHRSSISRLKSDAPYLILVGILASIILALLWTGSAYGYTIHSSDGVTIKDIQRIGTSESHKVLVEYCKTKSNAGFVGVLLSTDMEKIPILLDKQLSVGECQTYGSKIFASNISAIKTALFEKDDVIGLASQFDAKIASLDEKKVKAHQEIRKLKKSSYYDEKKIERLEKNIEQYDKFLKSAKSSLATLHSLRK